MHLELTPDFTAFSCHDDGEKQFSGQYEGKPSDSVSISVFDCMHVSGQCFYLALRSCVCVRVCYYIAAAIAVAATATIVATAASHAHPPSHVLCPSVHPVPSTHAKLEGEKSDPLQSKAQVLRQNMLLFPARPT